ncbi:unnamed protein product [Rotaria sp. Silwood1]|nr:unnamed protein product [Rotaria sp. Silwood1]
MSSASEVFPQYLIHAGDAVQSYNSLEEWQTNFADPLSFAWRSKRMHSPPAILYAHGNHDQDTTNRYIYTTGPRKGENWFSATLGTARFIVLDSQPLHLFKAQLDWLQRETRLETWNRASFRIAIVHIAPFIEYWEPRAWEELGEKHWGDYKLTKSNAMFPNITKLNLTIERRSPMNSLEFLRSVVDVSKLVEVKLESHCFHKDNQNLLFEIISILEQAYSLSSLIIHSRCCKYELYPFLNHIFSIIPRQIKRLQTPINQLDQIETILKRCQNLLVVRFEITRLKFSQEVIDWFNPNTMDSTFRRHDRCDVIWIEKKIDCIKHNHKRIKLNENQFDP